jgi:two-component system, sensor histidine kinase RegB
MTGTHMPWLIRLRWGAIVGQICTIALVHTVMAIRLPLVPLAVLIAIEALINLGLVVLKRSQRPPQTERLLAATLAADVVILTGILYFTGGQFNPFNFLYLVYIALAAVVLSRAWTWALVGLSVVCSAALFYGNVFLSLDYSSPQSHMEHMQMHMQGMWIAFTVAACFIGYFIARVRRALAEQEQALADERAHAARRDRLASLATLSAGAAHELATPLGTIAVVAKELERQAADLASSVLDDVRLIRAQVERCRAILTQMAADAGDPAGEAPAAVAVATIIREALHELPLSSAVSVETGGATADVRVPPRAVTQAVRAIVKNALEVSGAGAHQGVVSIATGASAGWATIRIADGGAGMTPEVLARAGEPFFTTKEPGRGMGLGLFLARTVLDRAGGKLDIASRPGHGTVVTIALPAT